MHRILNVTYSKVLKGWEISGVHMLHDNVLILAVFRAFDWLHMYDWYISLMTPLPSF